MRISSITCRGYHALAWFAPASVFPIERGLRTRRERYEWPSQDAGYLCGCVPVPRLQPLGQLREHGSAGHYVILPGRPRRAASSASGALRLRVRILICAVSPIRGLDKKIEYVYDYSNEKLQPLGGGINFN